MMLWQRDAMILAKRAVAALEAISRAIAKNGRSEWLNSGSTSTAGMTLSQLEEWVRYREKVFHDPAPEAAYPLPKWADPAIDYTGTILAAHVELLKRLESS